MADNLVLCGGTGAHVGIAFLRLHTLGYALGYFQRKGERPEGGSPLPVITFVDQDDSDGEGQKRTAAQEVRELLTRHPARDDWTPITGGGVPEPQTVAPIPTGEDGAWARDGSTVQDRFGHSQYSPLFFQDRLAAIDFSKGMIASPMVGSFLFKLKLLDRSSNVENHDKAFRELLQPVGASPRTVVIGSGVGGTGASVGPVLAEELQKRGHQSLSITMLSWFKLLEEGQFSTQARDRNEILAQNAASALRFYGETLCRTVAAAVVGVPDAAMAKRAWEDGDLSQGKEEHYLHAVAALGAWQHLTGVKALEPGKLFVASTRSPDRMDPLSAVPSARAEMADETPASVQELANRAQSLAVALKAAELALGASHGRVMPAIVAAVAATHADKMDRVVDALHARRKHFEEQLDWLGRVLGVRGEATTRLELEAAWRARITAREGSRAMGPRLHEGDDADQVAGKLFRWLANWVVDLVPQDEETLLVPSGVTATADYLPEASDTGVQVNRRAPGALAPVKPEKIGSFLEALVDDDKVAVTGWPHPYAAADHFRDALVRGDKLAVRQLELMLAGLASGDLRLVRGPAREDAPLDVRTIEGLLHHDVKTETAWSELAKFMVVDAAGTVFGATSPFTMVFPVPIIDGRSDRWETLWNRVTGRTDWAMFGEAQRIGSWELNRSVPFVIRAWIDTLRKQHESKGAAPKWLDLVFADAAGRGVSMKYGRDPHGLHLFWEQHSRWENLDASDARRALVDVRLPALDVNPDIGDRNTDIALSDTEREERRAQYEQRFRKGQLQPVDGFSVVRLALVGDKRARQFVWREHLDALVETGVLLSWGWAEVAGGDDPPRAHLVWRDEGGRSLEYTTTDLFVLDRERILVDQVPVFYEMPLVGGASAQLRFPDLPIRSRYLPLVANSGGQSIQQQWIDGQSNWADVPASPDLRDPSTVAWSRLRFLGRQDGLDHAAGVVNRSKVEPDPTSATFAESALRAQAMVWPRFRFRHPSPWRIYYSLVKFSAPSVGSDVLWIDRDDRLKTVSGGDQARPIDSEETHAVGWQNGQHRGGPPMAIVLFQGPRSAEPTESGLWLVHLDGPLPSTGESVKMALDFGTSHSAAALLEGGERISLALGPDLDERAKPSDRCTTLFVVSDGSRHPDQINSKLLRSGQWVPTYTTQQRGYVPTSLVFPRKFSDLEARLESLEPGRDFMIGSLDFDAGGGSDRSTDQQLSDYIQSNLKWSEDRDESTPRMQRQLLQRYYLRSLLEMSLVSAIKNHWKGLPTSAEITFTWPLRETDGEVGDFQTAVQEALDHLVEDAGLQQAKMNLYDESSAAMMSEKDRLVMVADLGGGTLDLHISQSDTANASAIVADSIKLGGGALIRKLSSSQVLPTDWGTDEAELRHILELWMREKGPRTLFDAGVGRQSLSRGYSNYPTDEGDRRERALWMVHRHFGHIYELLARYLVAYAHHHMTEAQRAERLSKTVLLLRGNGWRLHALYGDRDSHLGQLATRVVSPAIQARVNALWADLGHEGEFEFREPARYHTEDPKLFPITQAVDRHEDPQDVRSKQRGHTLVQLSVTGLSEPLPWHTEAPLDLKTTDAPADATLNLLNGGETVSPGLPLYGDSGVEGELTQLGPLTTGLMYEKLNPKDRKTVDGRLRVPVCQSVWETIHDKELFEKRDGGSSSGGA